MGNRKSQSDHDKMVSDAVKWLKNNGYTNIKADVTGYTSPDKITWNKTGKGHIPDLSATSSKGGQFIFEVETEDSIDIQHTTDQWTLFSAYGKQHSVEFWVIVPEGSKKSAEDRLKELKLTGKVWGV